MKRFTFLLMVSIVASLASCSIAHDVRVDYDFTSLYMPDSLGVTGGDGTISILLEDGSSLFMTGDCFLGKVENGSRSKTTEMPHNSLIHIDKDYKYLGCYVGGTYENPVSLCEPLEADTSRFTYWYWPGHGFQLWKTLFVYMTKFYQGGEGQWGFVYDGPDLLRLDMENGYRTISTKEVYSSGSDVHWGHCVLQDAGEFYVYGTRSGIIDPAQLCVSRVRFAEDKDEPLSVEYFDGSGWTFDSKKAAGCAGIDVSVSEQFSVFKYREKYVLITQRRFQQAGDIYSYIADTPVGPWRNKKLLYETKEQIEDPELFTYNAMAHPQYVNSDNELLICYNINSYNLDKPFEQVWTYRPVFLRVPMSIILDAGK